MDKDDINEECQHLYEEIEFCREKMRMPESELRRQVAQELADDKDGLPEEEYEKRQCDSWKKTFQRRSWQKNKATMKTLNELREFMNGLYRLDGYRRIKNDALPIDFKIKMSKLSKELDRKIRFMPDESDK